MSSEDVKVKVAVDQSLLKTGFAKLRNEFNSLKAMAAGAFAGFGAVALVEKGIEFGKEALDRAGQIQDTAERYDLAADSLQRLSQVAEQNGSSLDGVGSALNKTAVAVEKVKEGDKEATQALTDLGIAANDFANLSAEDAFYRISDGVANTEDRGKAYAAVLKLMGKSSGELFTTLELGSKVIREQGEAMGGMSAETIAQLDTIGDKLAEIKNKAMNFAGEAAIGIFNFLEGTMKGLQRASIAFREVAGWITPDQAKKEFEELSKTAEDKAEEKKKKAAFDPEADAKDKKDKAAKATVVADALTRAGGGGVAYLSKGVDDQKAAAKSLANIETVTKDSNATLKQIASNSGWS